MGQSGEYASLNIVKTEASAQIFLSLASQPSLFWTTI